MCFQCYLVQLGTSNRKDDDSLMVLDAKPAIKIVLTLSRNYNIETMFLQTFVVLAPQWLSTPQQGVMGHVASTLQKRFSLTCPLASEWKLMFVNVPYEWLAMST